ncbi:amidase family protein [Paenibacillus sp.]|uniref:amidase family protein n=1 Tax=Paenibacillus sp. TaxID=58172 RepID=UPI002D3CE479|nr:amidase family protein [Paenibacillus sp.]HZG56779.1 amidase family protein [Paenibacillus sp.]
MLSERWLPERSIRELAEALRRGETTSERLTLMYIERILTHDRNGMSVNSVLEINPDALRIAREKDAERAAGRAAGLLHGIPVLLKDNIDTFDRMHTSAGSIALADSFADADAFVAAKLRAAGAILLGKTNMTEWANFMSDRMPSGYSSRGGQVLNPYHPGTAFVGGSSSGSAAAAAANFAAGAIGTETSGSIISPASQHACAGIKPTVGLVSRAGIVPISRSQDTAGPIARTVADAAALLTAIAGADPADAATFALEGREPLDYTAFLDPEGLRGATIGVPRAYFKELPPETAARMEEAIAALREAGADVVDPVSMPTEDDEWDYVVLKYEFKPELNAYLGRLGPHVPVHSLEELIAFNERHADRALAYGQSVLLESQATSGDLREPEYLEARRRDIERSREQGIDFVLRERSLDALVFPNNWGCGIACKAGYPIVVVPAGFAGREPVGLSFVAGAFEEPKLIRLAYAFEQATKYRRSPDLSVVPG